MPVPFRSEAGQYRERMRSLRAGIWDFRARASIATVNMGAHVDRVRNDQALSAATARGCGDGACAAIVSVKVRWVSRRFPPPCRRSDRSSLRSGRTVTVGRAAQEGNLTTTVTMSYLQDKDDKVIIQSGSSSVDSRREKHFFSDCLI